MIHTSIFLKLATLGPCQYSYTASDFSAVREE